MSTQHKIIFTGTVGAGKTTAIMQLSDIAPISTEQVATDETQDKKKYTTVAMDYGSMRLEGGDVVHLYGTPGQQRFDFAWEVLIAGGIGLVILLDHSDPDPLRDLRIFIESFETFIRRNAVVVGITHMNYYSGPKLVDYQKVVGEFGLNPAVFEVDARNKDDIALLIQALLYTLDPGLVDTFTATGIDSDKVDE